MIGGISASKGARVLNFTERSRASPSGFVHRSLFDGYPDCFPVRQGVSRGSSSPNTPVSVLFDFLFGADDRSLCFDLSAHLVLHRQDAAYDHADATDRKKPGIVFEDCFHDAEVFFTRP